MQSDILSRTVPLRMFELRAGAFVSQAISVAATLRVADELASGSRPVTEIADAVGAHPPTLYRLLRVLGDVGVFQELEGQRFALTPLGRLLRSDVPGSVRRWMAFAGRPLNCHALSGLLGSVRTGEPAFQAVHGRSLFDYLADHPDDAAAFDAAMTDLSRQLIAPVVEAYDFTGVRTVVDVGGGNGALLATILTANPQARGILHDLPDVVAGAKRLLAAAGVDDRCDLVGGDFFTCVPAGGDAYLLANILHDWDDERAVRILANCRAAMADGGRVLLGEAVLPDQAEPSLAKLMDLVMLLNTPGGRQRTLAEYRHLLHRAGLRLSRTVPGEMYSLIETIRAGRSDSARTSARQPRGGRTGKSRTTRADLHL
jgi:SAM-dependent methyltransferase